MTVRALLGGGIGSGKTTAAGILAGMGAAVVSADEAGHRVLESGGPAARAVAARWPEVVVGGRIDRRLLGRVVFSDTEALRELESITHPAIRCLVQEQVGEAGPAPLVVVEVPLPIGLFRGGWVRLVVDAPDDVRMARLRARGMEPEEIADRMAVQPDRETWLASADLVIDNGVGLDDLAAECRRVWAELVDGGSAADR